VQAQRAGLQVAAFSSMNRHLVAARDYSLGALRQINAACSVSSRIKAWKRNKAGSRPIDCLDVALIIAMRVWSQ